MLMDSEQFSGTREKLGTLLVQVEDSMLLLGSLGLFLVMLVVTFSALLRYLFNSPISGVLIVTEMFALPLMVYFAAASLERVDGNISVDILQERLPDRVNDVVRLLYLVATLICFLIIIYLAAEQTISLYERNVTTSGTYNFPVFLSWAILPVGIGLLSIRLAIKIIAAGSTMWADVRVRLSERT